MGVVLLDSVPGVMYVQYAVSSLDLGHTLSPTRLQVICAYELENVVFVICRVDVT
jgi:hypothetical protein